MLGRQSLFEEANVQVGQTTEQGNEQNALPAENEADEDESIVVGPGSGGFLRYHGRHEQAPSNQPDQGSDDR